VTIKDAFQQYADKKLTAIKLIRQMTGMINPDFAVDIVALVNQVTRVEDGDLDMETFKEMHGLV